MKPVDEFKNRLFISSGVEPERIVEFSCDHIIEPENILPIIVNKGLEEKSFHFNFENRMKLVCMKIFSLKQHLIYFFYILCLPSTF